MSDVPFHLTRAGRTHYEHTVPEIAGQLRRLNELLERLVGVGEATMNRDPDEPVTSEKEDEDR